MFKKFQLHDMVLFRANIITIIEICCWQKNNLVIMIMQMTDDVGC